MVLRVMVILVVLGSWVALGGCGKPSAEATATQFVSLMQTGNFNEAAELWDLQAEGRAQNSDWDTFGESQRKLIIKKDLAPKKAALLQQYSIAFPTGTKVTQVIETGTTAQATLLGGQATGLQLTKANETWKIVGMQ